MFFFFQAEDGIRDRTVTGVQTCALPIWRGSRSPSAPPRVTSNGFARSSASSRAPRPEERRVGKECRSRGAPYHQKKKKDRKVSAEGKVRSALGPRPHNNTVTLRPDDKRV